MYLAIKVLVSHCKFYSALYYTDC